MVEHRKSWPLMCFAVLVAAVVSIGLLDGATAAHARPQGESPEEANAFLDRFVGRWIGEGTADGEPIFDDLVCERVLDGTFLLM